MKINKDEDLLKLARYLHNEKVKLKKENRVLEKEVYILNSIIKEVREYIREKARNNCWIDQYEANDLIKILDKVGSDKE